VSRERLEEVIDVAIDVLAKEGESALGINRVARELGVKPPSLYNHVRSGEDLRVQVAVRGWRLFAEAASHATASKRTPRSRLRALAGAYREFASNRPGLFAVMNTTQVPAANEAFARVSAELLDAFGAPLADLDVGAATRVHAIRAIRSFVHGFCQLQSVGQFALDASIDLSFERGVDAIVSGFVHAPQDVGA
jgi:AcrR family transcriptional regulator